MGFYNERIVPRIINAACGAKSGVPVRRQVCDGLAGDVLEIGFGTGHNVPFYPPSVEHVAAVEPADLCWRLAEPRLAATHVLVERSGLDGQSLPYGDGSFDAALSTYTLCTIPDPVAALREVARVLKDGGVLHFAEHGLAPDAKVRRFQHRIEPVNKRLLGGCHVTRSVTGMLVEAGFTVTALDEFYEKGAPRFAGALSVGTAIAE